VKRRDVAIVAGERDSRKVVSIPVDEEGLRKRLAEKQ